MCLNLHHLLSEVQNKSICALLKLVYYLAVSCNLLKWVELFFLCPSIQGYLLCVRASFCRFIELRSNFGDTKISTLGLANCIGHGTFKYDARKLYFVHFLSPLRFSSLSSYFWSFMSKRYFPQCKTIGWNKNHGWQQLQSYDGQC